MLATVPSFSVSQKPTESEGLQGLRSHGQEAACALPNVASTIIERRLQGKAHDETHLRRDVAALLLVVLALCKCRHVHDLLLGIKKTYSHRRQLTRYSLP